MAAAEDRQGKLCGHHFSPPCTYQLQVLAKCLIELGIVILVLSNLGEHLQALLHDVLLDHLKGQGHKSNTEAWFSLFCDAVTQR
eukprot:scaffold282184_cov17-Tisochrysis_lutea.AAC.2